MKDINELKEFCKTAGVDYNEVEKLIKETVSDNSELTKELELIKTETIKIKEISENLKAERDKTIVENNQLKETVKDLQVKLSEAELKTKVQAREEKIVKLLAESGIPSDLHNDIMNKLRTMEEEKWVEEIEYSRTLINKTYKPELPVLNKEGDELLKEEQKKAEEKKINVKEIVSDIEIKI